MEAFKEFRSSTTEENPQTRKYLQSDHITRLLEIKNIQQPITQYFELCTYGWYLNCSKKMSPACYTLKEKGISPAIPLS